MQALENVYLLPVSALLEAGRFPSHYDVSRRKQLVAASAIPPQAQVLLVSHPWESPGNPDPSGKQFLALRRFLAEQEQEQEEEKKEKGEKKALKWRGNDGKAAAEERRTAQRQGHAGTAGSGGFGYVWLSFSCTSSNRMKPSFQTHLNNVLTVIFIISV